MELRWDKKGTRLLLTVRLGCKNVDFMVDSGARTTLVHEDVVEECGVGGWVAPEDEDGGLYQIVGRLKAPLVCEGNVALFGYIRVSKVVRSNLLGRDILDAYNMTVVPDRRHPHLLLGDEGGSEPCVLPLGALATTVTVSGQKMRALLDTGAEFSLIQP